MDSKYALKVTMAIVLAVIVATIIVYKMYPQLGEGQPINNTTTTRTTSTTTVPGGLGGRSTLYTTVYTTAYTTTIYPTNTAYFQVNEGCYYIWRSNAVYTLTADISCASANTITFAPGISNVTLNCNGHQVLSTMPYQDPTTYAAAILMQGNDNNNTIVDCKVSGAGTNFGSNAAIMLISSSRNRMVGLTIHGGKFSGINMFHSSSNFVSNSTIINSNTGGILLRDTNRSTVAGNKLINSTIVLEQSSNCTISNNTGYLMPRGIYGITLGSGSYNDNLASNQNLTESITP